MVLQPDIEVIDFIADLGYRADHLDAKAPQRDNILKIANDGRNASLDHGWRIWTPHGQSGGCRGRGDDAHLPRQPGPRVPAPTHR